MDVAITGSGGREHALAILLASSKRVQNLHAWPGSDAIFRMPETVESALAPPDAPAEEVARAMADAGVDLCVIGPETHLARGLVDHCRAIGVRCWGPSKQAAQLETSKSFAKRFMDRHDIPTADWEVAETADDVRRIAADLPRPVVLKYDGLAGGKGVTVCHTDEDAEAYLAEVFQARRFGAPGPVVVEDYLEGRELSAICAVAGGDYHLFPLARDYKRLLDGDRGPNTGGMGAVSGPGLASAALRDAIDELVLHPTVAALADEEFAYRGFLYAGLMITDDGPRVLEFNCRFGDPEAQAVTPLLGGDVATFLWRAAGDELHPELVSTSSDWSVALTLATAGYPRHSSPPAPIHGLCDVDGAHVFHAGTAHRGDGWIADSGRVLTVVAPHSDLSEARRTVYDAAGAVQFDGMQFRRDIALLSEASDQ